MDLNLKALSERNMLVSEEWLTYSTPIKEHPLIKELSKENIEEIHNLVTAVIKTKSHIELSVSEQLHIANYVPMKKPTHIEVGNLIYERHKGDDYPLSLEETKQVVCFIFTLILKNRFKENHQ